MADKISGIYKITNIVNNKVYIGQSSDIKARWTHHKSDLNNERHHNAHLQSAWNKYGENKFVFSILEQCNEKELNKRERFWIMKYASYKSGYNLDFGGLGIRGYKHTPEQLDKMHRIQSPKIVLQFSLNYQLIKEWIGGVSHINRSLKYTKECILLRCEHRILNQMTPYKNSYWVYKDEYQSPGFSWNKYLHDVRYPNEPIICQYDTNFNLIREWKHRQELRDCNYDMKAIIGLCNKTATRRLYLGYIWAYKGDDFSDGRYGNKKQYSYKHITRKVNMKKEKNGTIVKSFDSIVEACDYLNRPHRARSNIIEAIKKTRRSCGYYWEYAD